MNEEVNNNENKKKQKVLALIGLITLLIAVLGATYAYFQISTDTESSNTNITGKTPPKSLVTLKQGTSNLHLNISASDMSYENRTKEYYGTDGDEPYVGTEELGTETIAEVKLTGGEETTRYSCTAKLTVSKVTDPDAEKDTMIEVLQPDDMILQFKGNIISEKLDLSDLKETGSKEYKLSFKVTGSTSEEIQAYIKLINKETQQNYLAGHKLNIDINTSDLKCEVALPDPKVAELRAKDKEVSGGVEHLSTDEQGGMYRYQGTDDVPNWICFGTIENCALDETDSDGNNIPDGIDKYMYRIIGITYYGEMYLLKETFLKEETNNGTDTRFIWNDKSQTLSNNNACDNKLGCDSKIGPEWNISLLFKRINGKSNGEIPGSGAEPNYNANTDNFVDSNEYDYLKSGDSNNGGKTSEWYNLIEEHNWMYGDIGDILPLNTFKAESVYEIETGKTDNKRYVGIDGKNTEEMYRWTQKVFGKISLMYIHDYYYSYYDGLTEESRGNAGSGDKLKNSWIHFQKDGYNTLSYEWLSTRAGHANLTDKGINAFVVKSDGGWTGIYINNAYGVRPTFYLSPDVKIKEGTDGTKANPYILDIQE